MSCLELTILGTQSGFPTPSRACTSSVLRKDGNYWMIDCGEGTQIQLQKSQLYARKIKKIFITHLHGDHMYGLPGFLCTVSMGQYVTGNSPTNPNVIELYGPHGLRKFLRTSLELSRAVMDFNYIVHELKPHEFQIPDKWEEWPVDHEAPEKLHISERSGGRLITADENNTWNVYEDDEIIVKAGMLKHSIPSFGYVFEEKPVPGKLDAAKLKEKGVAPGPLYAQIKAGNPIQTPSGETVNPEDVIGPSRTGRKVVILGDTYDPHKMTELAAGADLLVHESTLDNGNEERAVSHGHSTSGMAGAFAKAANVKKLVITHFSQRFKPLNTEIKDEHDMSIDLLVEEAKAAFGSDNVVAAEDLLTINIPYSK